MKEPSMTEQLMGMMMRMMPYDPADDEALRDQLLTACASHWKLREMDRMTTEQLEQALRCGLALAKTAAKVLHL